MRKAGVTRLIHGHTHRPAVHRFELDGQPAERIVLGDWYEQGSVLRVMPATVWICGDWRSTEPLRLVLDYSKRVCEGRSFSARDACMLMAPASLLRRGATESSCP